MSKTQAMKESYEKRPFTWNVSLTTLISAAVVVGTYFIAGELSNHSRDNEAHPDLRTAINANGKQLNRIEANQVAQAIESLDERMCNETNTAYRRRMRELLREYKELAGEDYPTFLLRCTNGNS